MKKRICLNMIVKNESAVIERCLDSLRDHIDAWVIVDTGSTDDTMEKIRACLKGIPGALHQREWRNFGSNRSEATALAYEGGCDYMLFMDADDVLLTPPKFEWPELKDHVYELWLQYGGYRYARQMLVSTKLMWRWVGVLHEYPESIPAAQSFGRLDHPQVKSSTEGARSSDPMKYHNDALLLEQGLKSEPNNVRYMFYLAQSYRDSGDLDAAIGAYERRVAAGGWEEEVWRSHLEIARLKEKLARPFEEIHSTFLKVFDARPKRAEPLVDLARIMRTNDMFAAAYVYAKFAATLPLPDDRLFVEALCYDFSALDELSIAAYWTGRYGECAELCTRLLSGESVPPEHRERVLANQKFARSKMIAG